MGNVKVNFIEMFFTAFKMALSISHKNLVIKTWCETPQTMLFDYVC
jgi:hypothetical protein